MVSYYIQETRQMIGDRGESVENIKQFLNDCSYLLDSYTGYLAGSNVITIMIETGDEIMLNQTTTPCL